MKRTRSFLYKITLSSLIASFCILASCSQPVLESEQCIASRDQVKKFYSYHFGNDMKPSKENLEDREKFLSKELLKELSDQNGEKDYFTQTSDYPKAFRAGSCENVGNNRTKFEVLLFWRDGGESIQRQINVEAVKEDDTWKIDKVSPTK